jgi:Domain of unknown function (DUF5018)
MSKKILQLTVVFFATIFWSCQTELVVPTIKSSKKAIITFSFNELNPIVNATIDENLGQITLVVPQSVDVKTLKPTISISPKAKISPDTGQILNFTTPVTYTVTAENGKTKTYVVTVTKSVIITPTGSNLPRSITFINTPVRVNDLETVDFTWENGILTKMVSTRTNPNTVVETRFTRNSEGLITKMEEIFNGSLSSRSYEYSADRKTITYKPVLGPELYIWTYNDKKFLLKRNYKRGDFLADQAVNLTWDDTKNQAIKVDDELTYNTLSVWSGPTNPLWEVTKQTQFLLIGSYNFYNVLLYLGQQVPDSWQNKSGSPTSVPSTVTVTKTLDAQNRLSRIVVMQGPTLAGDMKIVY